MNCDFFYLKPILIPIFPNNTEQKTFQIDI